MRGAEELGHNYITVNGRGGRGIGRRCDGVYDVCGCVYFIEG